MILKLLFAIILLVHGLIHLLGFLKEWHLAKVSQLSGKTLVPLSDSLSKVAGFFWLLTFILFVVSAAIFITGKEMWWIVAFFALLISQILIIFYWQDAKFGTIANIIIFIIVFLSFASFNLQSTVIKESRCILSRTDGQKRTVVTGEMLAGLPGCVQKWLVNSKVVGREKIQMLRLTQHGLLRTKPDSKWMPVEASQIIRIEEPAFIWNAKIQAAPLMHIYGRDKYENGRGNMLIKMLAFFPIANSKGREIDQGTLLRFLGEIVWHPTTALNEYIKWEQLDSFSAKATMTYGDVSASGIFRFNQAGDVASFEADRYYDRDGKFTLEKWLAVVRDFQVFEGVRIPVDSQVTWRLKTGDFTWYKFRITDIKYNITQIS